MQSNSKSRLNVFASMVNDCFVILFLNQKDDTPISIEVVAGDNFQAVLQGRTLLKACNKAASRQLQLVCDHKQADVFREAVEALPNKAGMEVLPIRTVPRGSQELYREMQIRQLIDGKEPEVFKSSNQAKVTEEVLSAALELLEIAAKVDESAVSFIESDKF